MPETKHHHCMNTVNFTQDESLLNTAFKQVIATPKFSFKSQKTTFAEGFPILPCFAENTCYRSYDRDFMPIITVGELWDEQKGNQSITALFSPEILNEEECTSFVNTAPKSLEEFQNLLREVEVGETVRYNLVILGVGIITIYAISLIWVGIFLGHLAMSKASKLFAISTTMLALLIISFVPSIVRIVRYFTTGYRALLPDLYFSTLLMIRSRLGFFFPPFMSSQIVT